MLRFGVSNLTQDGSRPMTDRTISPLCRRMIKGQGKRVICIMIVAPAGKLAIALWRYVELGLIPEGATLSAR